MATHFCNYLKLEGCSHTQWSRRSNNPLSILDDCRTLVILIKDSAIEEFIAANPQLKSKKLIHFSGALEIEHIEGFHPLMTFSKELYTLEEYREIPFIGTTQESYFRDSLPFLKNPYYKINRENKALYHSLCVIGGNFSSILWQKVFMDFQKRLNLPKEVLYPYLERVIKNITESSENSLTGPIKRDDRRTIQKNIQSLSNPWRKIYKLFRKAYLKEIK